MVFVTDGQNVDTDEQVLVATNGGNQAYGDSKKHARLNCYHCGERSHVKRNCSKQHIPKDQLKAEQANTPEGGNDGNAEAQKEIPKVVAQLVTE